MTKVHFGNPIFPDRERAKSLYPAPRPQFSSFTFPSDEIGGSSYQETAERDQKAVHETLRPLKKPEARSIFGESNHVTRMDPRLNSPPSPSSQSLSSEKGFARREGGRGGGTKGAQCPTRFLIFLENISAFHPNNRRLPLTRRQRLKIFTRRGRYRTATATNEARIRPLHARWPKTMRRRGRSRRRRRRQRPPESRSKKAKPS